MYMTTVVLLATGCSSKRPWCLRVFFRVFCYVFFVVVVCVSVRWCGARYQRAFRARPTKNVVIHTLSSCVCLFFRVLIVLSHTFYALYTHCHPLLTVVLVRRALWSCSVSCISVFLRPSQCQLPASSNQPYTPV